jgi:hypothetical protein
VGPSGWGRPWLAATAVGGAIGVAGYALFLHARPHLMRAGCRAETPRGSLPLDVEQAANSAVIAGVAFRKRLPPAAVIIAYATALQESRLRNPRGGDRDSVGLFQQRPSQGWGKVERLMDPIYATNRFFDALVKVDEYEKIAVADAAQRVQRSADGRAYAPHEPMARQLTSAFTGQARGAVHCWYPPSDRRPGRRADAVRELRRAFGPLQVDDDTVMSPGRRAGWAMAAWAISNAGRYGLTRLRYDGLRWTVGGGESRWVEDRSAPGDRVSFS